MRHGSAKAWFANGKPELEGTYQYGKKAGTFTFWHENGQVAATGEYRDDVAGRHLGLVARQRPEVGRRHVPGRPLIGDWRWWNEAGKLTKQHTYNGTESASTEKEEKVDVSKRPAKTSR